MSIHPTAIIDAAATVHPSCTVGPYCLIGPEVELGENCELISHVVIHGPTKIGKNNRIFPFSALGLEPQDITFKGQRVYLQIGDNNIIRESVTISRGTEKGGGTTRIGNNTFIMAYSHIGHDCQIGDYAMLVNGATLAGHVIVEEYAVLAALGPVHQFVRIGAHSYIGGGTTITQDVLPFTKTAAKREVSTFGINAIGLERRGFSKERIAKIQSAYKIIKRNNTTQALEQLKAESDSSEDVAALIKFLEQSERGIIK
ncbi:MAG: acyl-ACP--UDP-N-acetylglucosamine O-acyltransferase [Acidobacteriales bacterium]|nr:acyl-ACP--UDP-N-acetylglucosamine O-acyltransferase [Terriglobales bacterium]